MIFERYGNDVVDFEDQSQLPIQRLDVLRVRDGIVQFGEDSANEGCLESSNWTIDNISYIVVSSKWQERNGGSKWTDVEDSKVTSQLCTQQPEENREYRIVARIDVNGAIDDYASNSFARIIYEPFEDLVVESEEIVLNGSRSIYCTGVSNTDINGKNYTVFNSKWQSRPDSESVWSDVVGTETSGELCPLKALEGLEYLLVGSILVDGERGHRQSNIMRVESIDE